MVSFKCLIHDETDNKPFVIRLVTFISLENRSIASNGKKNKFQILNCSGAYEIAFLVG